VRRSMVCRGLALLTLTLLWGVHDQPNERTNELMFWPHFISDAGFPSNK